MSRKPRCPDVAAKIIAFLRDQSAVRTTMGVEITTKRLADIIGATQDSICKNMRRLIDYGIVFLPQGAFDPGHTGPKSFALQEGHEEGDNWKTIYYRSSVIPVNNTNNPLADQMVAKGTSDEVVILKKFLIEERTQNIALQEKVIAVQDERNKALTLVEVQRLKINELEEDLRLANKSARQNQEEIIQLDFQLKELLSKANQFGRQIAKNDETRPAFATSTR